MTGTNIPIGGAAGEAVGGVIIFIAAFAHIALKIFAETPYVTAILQFFDTYQVQFIIAGLVIILYSGYARWRWLIIIGGAAILLITLWQWLSDTWLFTLLKGLFA